MTEHLVKIPTANPCIAAILTQATEKIPKDVPMLAPRLTINEGSKPRRRIIGLHCHINAM
jgi:hypothetical protein